MIALREIRVGGRSRAYQVSSLLTVVLIAALAFLPRFFSGTDTYTVGVVGTDTVALAETIRKVSARETITTTVKILPDEAAARTAVTREEIDAAVLDGRALLVKRSVDPGLASILQESHRATRAETRLRAAGLEAAAVADALQVAPLTVLGTDTNDADAGVRRLWAMVLSVLLFMQVVMLATWVAQGVVEEKSSRIVELMLASVRSWHLLAGKIIGLGVLGFAQFALISGGALAAAKVGGLALPPHTSSLLLAALGWFVLAYAFYGALYAAIASLISRHEELQSVLTPATILMMGSYFVAFLAAIKPTGNVAQIMSMIPPFSAFVMPVRMTATSVAGWEVVVAVAGMLAATTLVLVIGAWVYGNAVLRTGGRARLGEVLRRPQPVA